MSETIYAIVCQSPGNLFVWEAWRDRWVAERRSKELALMPSHSKTTFTVHKTTLED